MRYPNRRREPLLKPADVGQIFDVEAKTVVEWAKTGKIRSLRTPGGQYRFRESDVEALLASGLDDQSVAAPAEFQDQEKARV
jgi:excisionase family DNA binding protein